MYGENVLANSELNVVYWMERHLLQDFGVSLLCMENWKDITSLQIKLWYLGTDATTIRLRNRAYEAGYPLKYFGFHSLRSGFISSALLKAGNDQAKRAAVLEQSTIVARWIPYSRVQMGYVKKSTIGMHVANRLVLPDSELSSTAVVESALTQPELFHNRELTAIPWMGGEKLECFNKYVSVVVGMCCALLTYSTDRQKAMKDKAILRFDPYLPLSRRF
ncbi:hypothetical protein BLNAU_517 [Blattamonas nauphoetae]|uniref:Uncharacterized protein n=1 Tax=Blattamonas nauphoetae TaxID=2049346 RepID=A0ABQ9YLG4_9EUKA|nr:hypothetical protein BLNAU_517 [Blattamonas nauphoetae]